MKPLDEPVGQYIDGRFTAGTSAETFPTRNPATGQVIAQVRQASAGDVDAAVASARRGFEQWSTLTGAQRGRVLMNAVRLLRERNDELAELEVLDTGKPISEANVVRSPKRSEFGSATAAESTFDGVNASHWWLVGTVA